MQTCFSWLGRLFPPPVIEGDEESTRLASLLNTIIWVILVFAGIYVLAFLFFAPQLIGRLYLIAPVFVVLGICLLLLHRRQIRFTSWLVVSGVWLVVTFSAASSGGVRAPGYSGNIVIVLIAGLLLGRRVSLMFAGLGIVSGLVMIWAEQNSLLPPLSPPTTSLLFWLAQAVFFIVAAAVLQLATNTIQGSLQRARRELAEREHAESALQESEERLRLLSEASFEGIMIHDQTRIIDANRALSEISGYALNELVGMNGVDFIVPEDRKRVWRNVLLGGEEPVEVRALRKDGRMIWVEIRGRPLVGPRDGLRIVAIHDTSERKRVEEQIRQQAQRAQALAEISQLLAEVSQDYQKVLDLVTRRVSELFGDVCTVRLISQDPEWIELAAVYHPDPEVVKSVRGLYAAIRLRADEGVFGQVIRTGQPVRMSTVTPEEAPIVNRLEFKPFLELFPTFSRLAVPLRAQGHIIGVLALGRYRPEPVHTLEDQIFLQDLSDRAALALANARLYTALQKELAERQRAEEQIQSQLHHLTALHAIDTAITANLDLPTILTTILDQVTAQLNVHAADILLLNFPTQTLEYSNGLGFKTKSIQHSRLRLGTGFAGQAVLERRSVFLTDLAKQFKEFERGELTESEGFQTYIVMPLLAKGEIKGAMELFHRAPLDPDPEWFNLLRALATQAAIAVDNMSLFDDLQRSNLELSLAYDTTLEGWTRALDLRDRETEGHTRRVTDLTVRLARALGFTETELAHLRRGALLHDIGKIGIPDSILLKPGPLTDEEISNMHKHPIYAYEMLAPIAYLRPALDIPYCHHEKWDGTGYPRGLRAEQIPLAARIFAVIDVWDAVCSDRPYRPAWDKVKALEYVRAIRGQHLDPQVVDKFLEMHYELEAHLPE